MTSTDLVPQVGVLSLPQEQQSRILMALGLDMRQPITQALLLVAERYDLDPLLKQVQIIKQNVYITHAGLLHIAHTSGKLDGIVVEDECEDKDWYRAQVSVYRKDMAHPFKFSGKFRKSKVRSDGASGEEMALKNAERSALRRAFDICAPTMDDSGQDMDDVPPGTDIDLPSDSPPLPSAEDNALPVPDPPPFVSPPAASPVATPPATAPPESAMPPPSAMQVDEDPKPARKIPTGSVKVSIPETGEVVHLSTNGHIVDTQTGGEVFAATEEQVALQARAREIVAQAEAELEAKPKAAAPAKKARAVKKTAKVPDAPAYTDEEIKRGQSLHMKAKELNIEETLMRDVIFAVTSKRTKSSREVSHDESDTIKAIMVAIAGDLVELEYDEDGTLVIDITGNPLPPDDAEEDTIEDAEVVTEPTDWKKEANVRYIKDGMFLRKARALAEEMGITLPSSFRDIAGAELEAALWAWLREQEEVNA